MRHPIDFDYTTGRTLTAELRDTSGVVLSQAMTEDGSTGYYYITSATLTGKSLPAGEYTVRVSDSVSGVVGVGGLVWSVPEDVAIEYTGQLLTAGGSFTATFYTRNQTTKALQNADSTPTISVSINGTETSTPTPTNVATGTYTVAVAAPSGATSLGGVVGRVSYTIDGVQSSRIFYTGQVAGQTFDGPRVETMARAGVYNKA